MKRLNAMALAATLALVGMTLPTVAQDAASYPDRPVTIVVPYSAGGGNDVLARVMATLLEGKLGQRFLVENRPGAGSAVGTVYVKEQAADGYSILFSTSQYVSTNLTLKDPGYELGDFVPVALISASGDILTVPASLGVNSVPELVEYVKARPDSIGYGSVGIGSNVQVLSAMFNKEAGLDMIEVPYGGGGDVLKALLANEVAVYFGSNVQTAQSADPNLRFLAIAGENRSKFLADLPTLRELGYERLVSAAWSAMFVRADTPAPILDKLRATVSEIVRDPATAVELEKLSLEPYPGTVADFEQLIAAKIDEVRGFVEEFDIELQ